MNKKIALVWALAFLAMVGYLWFIEGSLPDRLAVHFDISGKPNGFQTKDVFANTFLTFIVFINALFLVLFIFIDRFPKGSINILWKDYWFATEERTAEAFRRVKAVLGLVGIFICTIFLITEHIIYQANAQNPWFVFPINGGMLVIFALIALLLALSIVITKPPKE